MLTKSAFLELESKVDQWIIAEEKGRLKVQKSVSYTHGSSTSKENENAKLRDLRVR